MRSYRVLYAREDEFDLIFLCQADDDAHATEQLMDAEPHAVLRRLSFDNARHTGGEC